MERIPEHFREISRNLPEVSTVGLTHDFGQPEEVNVSERQGVRGRLGAHFKGFGE